MHKGAQLGGRVGAETQFKLDSYVSLHPSMGLCALTGITCTVTLVQITCGIYVFQS